MEGKQYAEQVCSRERRSAGNSVQNAAEVVPEPPCGSSGSGMCTQSRVLPLQRKGYMSPKVRLHRAKSGGTARVRPDVDSVDVGTFYFPPYEEEKHTK